MQPAGRPPDPGVMGLRAEHGSVLYAKRVIGQRSTSLPYGLGWVRLYFTRS